MPGAGAFLYTVPAGRTLVLTSVAIANPTGAAITMGVYLQTAAGVNQLLEQRAIPGLTAVVVFDERGIVFNPGDHLVALPTAAGLVVTGFGSLLVGAPS